MSSPAEDPDRLLAEATALEAAGRWAEARAVWQRLARHRPGVRCALAIAGTWIRENRLHEALAVLVEADARTPDVPQVRYRLVELACRLGEPDMALRRVDRWLAVRNDPGYRELRARVLGDFPGFGARVWVEVPAITPQEFLRRLGEIEASLTTGNVVKGERQLVELARCVPAFTGESSALQRLLAAAGSIGCWPEAEQAARALLERERTPAHLAQLAATLFNLARYRESAALFLDADRAAGGDIVLRLNALMSLMQAGEHQAVVDQALAWDAISPDERLAQAAALNLLHAQKEEEADAFIRQARQRYPGNRYLRLIAAKHALQAGDYTAGFDLYRDRWVKRPEYEPTLGLACPVWDGEPFNGRLLVAAEEALGEEVLASSLYPALRQRQADVLVEADARLLPLLARSFPGMRFVPRGEGALVAGLAESTVPCRKVAAGDLFHHLLAPGDIGNRKSWLVADPLRVQGFRDRFRARYGERKVIGIAWRSIRRDAHEGFDKNFPLESLQSLLQGLDDRFVFVSVQHGLTEEEAARIDELGLPLHIDRDLRPTEDIDGLTAYLNALDLLVSASNTNVHLAGATGVETWLLLRPRQPIMWYWGYRGERSLWYPSVRCFRHSPGVDTDTGIRDVIAQARAALSVF